MPLDFGIRFALYVHPVPFGLSCLLVAPDTLFLPTPPSTTIQRITLWSQRGCQIQIFLPSFIAYIKVHLPSRCPVPQYLWPCLFSLLLTSSVEPCLEGIRLQSFSYLQWISFMNHSRKYVGTFVSCFTFVSFTDTLLLRTKLLLNPILNCSLYFIVISSILWDFSFRVTAICFFFKVIINTHLSVRHDSLLCWYQNPVL